MLFGIILNIFYLIIFGIEKHSLSTKKCIIVNKWLSFAEYYVPLDLILNTVVPFIIISILNTLIVFKLSYVPSKLKQNQPNMTNQEVNDNKKNQHKTYFTTHHSVEHAPKSNSLNETKYLNVDCINSIKIEKISKMKFFEKVSFRSDQSASDSKSIYSAMSVLHIETRKKKYSKTSKVLFLISITFLILHFPLCYSKIYYIINMNSSSENFISDSTYDVTTIQESLKNNQTNNISSISYETDFTYFEKSLFKISNMLYFLNFGLNFFLYSFNRTI